MASIDKLPRKRFDEMLASFSGNGPVYAAYELLPWRWIVAGLPQDLASFSQFLKEREKEAVWRYIPSTIAAHSPYLSYALETSPLDARRLGLRFRGEDMKIPVWANDTGTDLRTSQNVIFDVMQAYFIHRAVWRSQISPLLPPTKITYVLDFGPGPGVAGLTENHAKAAGIQVIRCTVPLGRKRLFEEVLPVLGQ